MSRSFKDEASPTQTRDPPALPTPPRGYSRVDALPDEFAAFLARRPLLVGDVIGQRYRLERLLSGGAMGEVFVAENLAIGRRVAVKVLRPELLIDPQFRKRFQHEAEAIAAIEHRNVVRFLDLLVGDPTFLVMEYAPGPTLAELLRDGQRLELGRALGIARRLCWALDAAHRAGVVHRDVKPANVILVPDPETGEEPKLIDFGLAKLAIAAPEEQLTRAGQILGTPFYMSPEQVANQPVDARSDIYALGCLLYHLVAGRPPFEDGDEVQVLYQHRHVEAPPLRQFAADAPRELEAVLERALAKDPATRFASMREMVDALDRIGPAPAHAAARPPSRRTVGVTAALLIAATAALVILATRVRHASPFAGTMLLVTTDPPGAQLLVDGRALGDTTPAALRVDPGRHVVRARLDGHAEVEQVVTLERDRRVAVQLVLPATSREVQIQTVPPGAQVYVDGLLLGSSPLTAVVAEDDFHEFRVEKSGYQTLTKALPPEDRSTALTLELTEERQPRGTLWIDANRAASVFLDGNSTGLVTPTIGIRVAPGRHTIELRDASGQRGPSVQVQIRRGETQHLTLDLGRRE